MKSRVTIAALIAASAVATALAGAAPAPADGPVAVHVQGNQLVDVLGAPIRLIGVDRASFEYTCVSPIYSNAYRNGTHTGPIDANAIAAMKTWHINAVRIPLNEDCWLGINPVKRTANHVKPLHGAAARRAGAKLRQKYQADVQQFVSDLNAQGIVAILDLHWAAPGKVLADKQLGGPDTSHSVDFWRSVATTFKDNSGVIFDLFNEPKGISWQCLRDGGCPLSLQQVKHGQKKQKGTVVGMQTLLDTVRATGATQPVMIGGLDYSDDLTRWLEFEPHDPLADTDPRGPQIIASFHNYGADNPQGFLCHQQCWDQVIAPVAAQVPVVTGEFGQDIFKNPPKCGSAYNTSYMDWADQHGVSYLAWWWYVASKFDGKGQCLALIKDYGTGEPTDYGLPIMQHYLQVNP